MDEGLFDELGIKVRGGGSGGRGGGGAPDMAVGAEGRYKTVD